MKKKINYYLVATALFVAIATMVSMTVINYYLFQKQVKEDLQVMADLHIVEIHLTVFAGQIAQLPGNVCMICMECFQCVLKLMRSSGCLVLLNQSFTLCLNIMLANQCVVSKLLIMLGYLLSKIPTASMNDHCQHHPAEPFGSHCG